jgi:hypothetical protein
MASESDLAPGLVRPDSSRGLLARFDTWRLARQIRRRIEGDRILEWRRLAPGGTPLWVLPDAELEATINRMAASSRARSVELTYFLAEFDRRQRRRLNEGLADANRKMVLLTRAVVVLTGVSVVLAVVSTIAIVA